MALVGNDLYVANTDAVLRFPYQPAQTRIDGAGDQGGRPAGRADQPPLDQERDRQRRTARKLYVTVGSNSNVAENGMAAEDGRAAIWEIDRKTGAAPRLRHPACAIRTAWPGEPTAARCGRWSTSATSSAATSCPTT